MFIQSLCCLCMIFPLKRSSDVDVCSSRGLKYQVQSLSQTALGLDPRLWIIKLHHDPHQRVWWIWSAFSHICYNITRQKRQSRLCCFTCKHCQGNCLTGQSNFLNGAWKAHYIWYWYLYIYMLLIDKNDININNIIRSSIIIMCIYI